VIIRVGTPCVRSCRPSLCVDYFGPHPADGGGSVSHDLLLVWYVARLGLGFFEGRSERGSNATVDVRRVRQAGRVRPNPLRVEAARRRSTRRSLRVAARLGAARRGHTSWQLRQHPKEGLTLLAIGGRSDTGHRPLVTAVRLASVSTARSSSGRTERSRHAEIAVGLSSLIGYHVNFPRSDSACPRRK